MPTQCNAIHKCFSSSSHFLHPPAIHSRLRLATQSRAEDLHVCCRGCHMCWSCHTVWRDRWMIPTQNITFHRLYSWTVTMISLLVQCERWKINWTEIFLKIPNGTCWAGVIRNYQQSVSTNFNGIELLIRFPRIVKINDENRRLVNRRKELLLCWILRKIHSPQFRHESH